MVRFEPNNKIKIKKPATLRDIPTFYSIVSRITQTSFVKPCLAAKLYAHTRTSSTPKNMNNVLFKLIIYILKS